MNESIANNKNTDNEIKIILTSKNSEPVKMAIDKISKAVMLKNKELYRRLGNK